MPRTYTRRFRVRWTDCDASGHVSHVAFLCYTQEMGFEAGTDAGYGLPWWTEVGVGWLARRSHIEYFQPVRYGDELDATTYLASFSRIRAQRNYDFVRRDATLVAQAEIDWVLFDRRTGAPARLSADVMRAFRPEGPEPDAQSRPLDATPLPDSPPPGAYRTSRRVYYADIDEYQHVNNAVYLSYVEQATIDADASLGFDIARLRDLGGLFVVGQHDIEYLRAAKYGDTLDIDTWIGEVTRSSILRHYTMRVQGGELSIRAQTRWAWIDLASKQPTPIPANLLEALTSPPREVGTSESGATVVSESDESIKLGAFLFWKGLANGEDQARQLIPDGGVRVNGQIEEQPKHRLFNGDVVAIGGRTFTVDLSEPHGFIRLDRFLVWQRLARHGRQAEDLIRSGAVRVNGQTVTQRTHRLFHGHTVTLDDKTITVDLRQSRRSIKLDQFLHSQGIGKVGRWIRAGAVRLNGHVESWRSRKLFHGDVVVVVGPLYEGDTAVGAREFKVDLSEDAADLFDEE